MTLSKICILLLLVGTTTLEAQRRPASAPEAELMSYFAAAMTFTPVGLPAANWEIGGSLGFIPQLTNEDRAAGFGGTKYENVNLCPLFPRLTAGGRLGALGSLGVEAGWTPPIEVCGVRANIGSLAVSYRRDGGTLSMLLRASAVAGALRAPITCSDDAIRNPADQTCYGGTESYDRMAPFSLGLEAGLSSRRLQSIRLEPYILAGIARHRTRFDVNFDRPALDTGAILLPALSDHNQFEATRTRVHFAAGFGWRPTGGLRVGGEVFVAPGSLITWRARLAIPLGAPREL
jgi:hypothetical protein